MTKRITRSARRSDTKADGNLVKVSEAAFVSLVGMPANQRPFQVIRSQKPVKRGETAVLMLTFPDDFTEDDVNEAMALFGMDGNYTVVATETGYAITRSDLQSVAKVQALKPVEFRITKDITAHLDPKQYQPKAVERGEGVVVVGVNFDKKTFDNEKIISWGKQNSVDISDVDIENSTSAVFSVSRMEVPAGTEVRQMELEEGLTVQVARSADVSYVNGWPTIPDGYVEVVSEAAYGQWGWGQVDFAASMMDEAFCDLVYEANSKLWDVLYNIMFYSYQSLDVRKQLVSRCLAQYEAFVHGLLDSLPSQVLLLASRADSIKRKESDMAIDKAAAEKELAEIEAKRKAEEATKAEEAAKAEEAKRAESATATTDEGTAAAAAAGDEKLSLTRAELTVMVAEGVKVALAAKDAAEVEAKRAAKEAEEKAAADKAAAEAATAATATRSDSGISKEDIAAIVTAVVAPLSQKIERMENTAVVRSDADDANGTKKVEAKRGTFAGVFGSFGDKA